MFVRTHKAPVRSRAMFLIAILSVLSVSLLSTGCLREVNRGLRYTDDMGDTITLEYVPMRIVTLSPALTEMVYLLDMGDRIVGRDSACDHPEEAKEILVVSTWEGPDLEKLTALEPDLILMDRTLDLSGEHYLEVKELGFPVYRVYPLGIEDVFEGIEDIGRILGAPERARTLSNDLRGRADDVMDRTSSMEDGKRPVVLHVVYYDGTADPWVATGSTFSGDIIHLAGGMNPFDGTGGMYVQVPIERTIAADPDLIITSQSSTGPTVSRTTILSDPLWKDLTAVKNGQVHDVEADWLDRPGPRCVNGLERVYGLVMNSKGGG